MLAQMSHTIDIALANGYGRCRGVPVWIVHCSVRAVSSLFPVMLWQHISCPSQKSTAGDTPLTIA